MLHTAGVVSYCIAQWTRWCYPYLESRCTWLHWKQMCNFSPSGKLLWIIKITNTVRNYVRRCLYLEYNVPKYSEVCCDYTCVSVIFLIVLDPPVDHWL